jgi:hypothetical protein
MSIESLEAKKKRLLSKSQDYLLMMDSQVSDLSTDVKKWGKVLLVSGGVMLLSYFIFGGSKPKKKTKSIDLDDLPEGHSYYPAKQESEVVRIIKTQVTLMLIGLARQKLMEFISSLSNKSQVGPEEDSE